MLPPAFSWLEAEFQSLEQAGLLRRRWARDGMAAAEISSADNRWINFGSNDYLGLAGDARLGAAAGAARQQYGSGAGASPLVTGRTTLHEEFEQELAAWLGVEATLLFPTGFATGAGVIPALVGKGDLILADAKNHASLIDGCRLSKADRKIFAHRDADQLALLLAGAKSHSRRLIVTDALFSMDGDFADLAAIGELAERHNAMLLVDEAHALGVWGPEGRGAAAEIPQVDQYPGLLRVGTLSKAFGSSGGFVAGSQRVIEWLANRARTYVFSTAAPAATVAAAREALRIMQHEPERRTRLQSLAGQCRQSLSELGWNVGATQSQIIPLIIGDPDKTMQVSARLQQAGLYLPGIRPPTVPQGESLLRVSLSSFHTDEMIAQLHDNLGDGNRI